MQIVLASSSKARAKLLESIYIYPDKICPANIDETPQKKELPNQLALRLAKSKADVVASTVEDGFIIAADTVSARGRMILPKATSDEEVIFCLKKLSGRRHKVYTGVAIYKLESGVITKKSSRLVTTIVKFKSLLQEEIDQYVASGEGVDKSGGLSIEGLAASYVSFISGSYSNVIGLPLYETRLMLTGLGYKFRVIKR
jgi:septum formation protein